MEEYGCEGRRWEEVKKCEEKRREKVEEKLEEVRVGASSDDLTIHQSALTEYNEQYCIQLFTE